MAALETTLFVSAKTSKDSKYQWYDYVRMLEHFSTFGRLWMLDINSPSISQTFDRNYLKHFFCMEKAIAQQSSVSASDANTIAIISTLLSAQSILAQGLNTVHHTIW